MNSPVGTEHQAAPAPEVGIRHQLHPGDLGAIVALHGRLYAAEYGLDSRFEAHVGRAVAEAGGRGFPRARESIRLVESAAGDLLGCCAMTDEGGFGMVRWVVLDQRLRGSGLGRRLISETVEEARLAGFGLLALETFSDLTTAASIYRSLGFVLVGAETGSRWGRSELTYQRYELGLG